MAKPFIKWAGSKTRLFPQILKRIPADCSRYVEPFVGGGAVLFEIAPYFDEIYLSDTNEQLIGTYRDVQNNAERLITLLSRMQDEYQAGSAEERTEYYTSQRLRHEEIREIASTERSALFLFLNMHCFSHRYNPHGSDDDVTVETVDADNLRTCSDLLQDADIRCRSYENTLDVVNDRTFVYCDPPYRPLGLTTAFSAFTKEGFNDESQNELARYARRVVQRNGRILLSNSDPHNLDPNDNFFDNLYNGFTVERVSALQPADARRRGITELLIHSDYGVIE